METPQTVAQAVAQATQAQQQAQQQHQHQHTPQPQTASPAVQPPQSTPSSTIDNLTCQWQGCGERTDSAESLYDHVCERHVGRKSTNNLNLTCQWGACRTTTVKRDHITSHIRVHVPLKPHKCDFCGKAFKRPQDLKKHVKTHADDSVLTNSPHQSAAGRSTMGASGGVNGYYTAGHDNGMSSYPSYQPALGAGAAAAAGYVPAANGQYAGYGAVSYPNSSAMADIQSMDTRRRAIEALNDFLGDIKRRAINPSTYYDVGHRLQGNALPLPIGNGYNTGYSNPSSNNTYGGLSAASLLESFNNSEHMTSVHSGSTQQGYSLPLPNARTKSDLQDIDRFLEQLQATVYETSTQAAAAGVQQHGVHTHYPGDYGFGQSHNMHRSSNSPTGLGHFGHGGNSFASLDSANSSNSMPQGTSALDTPALTPASVSSYASSGHSPMSTHSRASLGSLNSGNMYPHLSSVADYSPSTSAPASGLASDFNILDTRRMSGGKLQKAQPPSSAAATASEDTEMPDADDGSRTPKASDMDAEKNKSANSIDPALREEAESASTPLAQSESEDKRDEDWVENIRTIEALRKWVADRLRTGEYEEETADNGKETDSADKETSAAEQMAETAKMVEERMAKALAADKAADEAAAAIAAALASASAAAAAAAETAAVKQEDEVKYPSLPTES